MSGKPIRQIRGVVWWRRGFVCPRYEARNASSSIPIDFKIRDFKTTFCKKTNKKNRLREPINSTEILTAYLGNHSTPRTVSYRSRNYTLWLRELLEAISTLRHVTSYRVLAVSLYRMFPTHDMISALSIFYHYCQSGYWIIWGGTSMVCHSIQHSHGEERPRKYFAWFWKFLSQAGNEFCQIHYLTGCLFPYWLTFEIIFLLGHHCK